MVSPSWDMGSLGVFEAVGRLENLTLAARELGMTQPAVSYQIKRMEDRLGVSLFARRARGVEILPEGRILYDAVRRGLDGIEDAIQQIKRRQRTPGLRIATDYGFAAFWLMPRVAKFRPRHPDVDVRITASSMIKPLDYREADVAILFGAKDDVPKDSIAFIGEAVVPVCSPAFLEEHGPFPNAAGIKSSALLHLDTLQGDRWYTWPTWLEAINEKIDEGNYGLIFNTYNLVLEAAMADQGIALGWVGLIDNAIARGKLVHACDVTLTSAKGYWLVFSPDISNDARALCMQLLDITA
ncbi:LysR substrate-binding domain-containing protein [Brucella pseudogrignonensis]|uniref:Choline sulfate-utilization transcription factor n=1 Tax=Brucella pseudogrignonensis TaxID=419475 RepID=A0ABU1MDR4_9HYPH|nr:LysR substrate-binding domain-containing protein [Brucella pseudogrignonensis]MDR6434179.1 putative choline sulfate-utilization transcription factor [Brucella pseudogrignonensis]